LESILSNDGRSEKEIKSRVGQAKKAFLVKYKLLTSKNIDLRVRKCFIKTAPCPRPLHFGISKQN